MSSHDDQRGTGACDTTPKCVSSQTLPLTTRLSQSQVATLYQTSAKECVDSSKKQGVDILGYTIKQSTLDINELRQYLQAEK